MTSVPSKEFLAAFEHAAALAGMSVKRESANKAHERDHVCYLSRLIKIGEACFDRETSKGVDWTTGRGVVLLQKVNGPVHRPSFHRRPAQCRPASSFQVDVQRPAPHNVR